MKYQSVHYVEVKKHEVGTRLLRWLQKRFSDVPKGHLHRVIRKGQVRIDGKRAQAHCLLEEGHSVRIPPFFHQEKPSCDLSLPLSQSAIKSKVLSLRNSIIHKNDEMIVLNKPAEMACQGGRGVRVSVDRLLPSVLSGGIYLVHRLDKATTGVLVVARTRDMAARLSYLFAHRKIRKIYIAIIFSSLLPEEGTWDTPLEDKHGFEQPAKTTFYTLMRHPCGLCLVVFLPHTGRKHQLRKHASNHGSPIIGDTLYGERKNALLREVLGNDYASAKGKMYLHSRGILVDNHCYWASLPHHFHLLFKVLGWSLSTLSCWENFWMKDSVPKHVEKYHD